EPGSPGGHVVAAAPGTAEQETAGDRAPRFRAVRKYFNIFRVSLIERMAYRGDFLLGTCLRFFPMITTILLWHAVYSGSGRERLAGSFTLREMVSYLLLIHVSRMFSSMPGLSAGIAYDIREGHIKKY